MSKHSGPARWLETKRAKLQSDPWRGQVTISVCLPAVNSADFPSSLSLET